LSKGATTGSASGRGRLGGQTVDANSTPATARSAGCRLSQCWDRGRCSEHLAGSQHCDRGLRERSRRSCDPVTYRAWQCQAPCGWSGLSTPARATGCLALGLGSQQCSYRRIGRGHLAPPPSSIRVGGRSSPPHPLIPTSPGRAGGIQHLGGCVAGPATSDQRRAAVGRVVQRPATAGRGDQCSLTANRRHWPSMPFSS
jgi:hypothetical protein